MNKTYPKIGDKYNYYTIISEGYYLDNKWVVKCQCKCGFIKTVAVGCLKRLKRCHKCAGKEYRRFNIGDQTCDLTIINYESSGNESFVKVKCKCGIEYKQRANTIGKTKCCKYCHQHKEGTGHSSYKGLDFVTRNLEFDIDINYINDLLIRQNHKCKLSGIDISIGNTKKRSTASLDRIDSTKGYTKDNIQWLHKDVNRMKQEFSQEYFINICKNIVKRTRI